MGNGKTNMETKIQQKARNWMFTIHNYDRKILKRFTKVAQSLERHNYICFGLEKGENKETPHIQGYIELDDNQALTFTQNYFNLYKNDKLIKFHLQATRGSSQQNQEYTSKEGQWWEFGVPKKNTQGKRNDMEKLRNRIFENPKSYNEMLEHENLNFQQIKYMQQLLPVAYKHRNPEKPPIVFWIYGSSGSGKTKLAFDSFRESICKVSNFNWLGTGYTQQGCFLLDDLRTYSIEFNELLTLIDVYPTDIYFKGGSMPFKSPYIVITTPQSIKETFKNIVSEDITQITRRITYEINQDIEKVEDLKKYIKEKPEN
jgi:hypothetical protein